MKSKSKDIFYEKLQLILDNQELVKLILNKKRSHASLLKKLTIKPFKIQNDIKLSFIYTYNTKDITKNYDHDSSIDIIKKNLENDFYNADLYSVKETIQLITNKKNNSKLIIKEPIFTTIQSPDHDKQKKKRIELKDNIYLQELGITNEKFELRRNMNDKYRQINKFLEIIESLLPVFKNKKELKIVDMGSGKAYLSFALYDFLKNSLNLTSQITGIEYRDDLVLSSNRIAEKSGFDKLKFIQGSIEQSKIGKVDILIALHACDTATDEAIFKGIESDADLIIVSPCCHKQIRRQFNVQNELASVVKHGILKERQAELITDGIRALILEAYSYKTKVFEFISTEHTAKNLMIVGTKHKKLVKKVDILNKIKSLKEMFGIEYHHLEKLLKI